MKSERYGFVDGLPVTYRGETLEKLLFRFFRESHAGGRLHLIDVFIPSPSQFKVLEMGKDYSAGWFVKYNVDLDPLWTAHPLRHPFFTILSLAPNDQNKEEEEEESSSVLLLHIPGTLSGNLLTGFGFYEPYWLVDFTNACIVLHLVGGYQVYSQPVFAVAERWFSNKYPNSAFVNNYYSFKIPVFPRFQVNPFRLCFRTVYVISTTGIAMLFPYLNPSLGSARRLELLAPLAIYFPVEMYFVQKKIGTWTKKWIALQAFSFVCFLVTVVGVIGSIEGLISAKLS